MAVMSAYGVQQFSIYEMFGSEPTPPFESRQELESGWGRNWGCDNDIGRLFYLAQGIKDVIIFDPETGFVTHSRCDSNKRHVSPVTIALECGCECVV